MKKIVISLLSLLVLITLGGCQSKFDPTTALKDSRETLNDFLVTYEDEEQVSEQYNKESLEKFFIDYNKDIFTENFKENILPQKLENLKFDSEKDFRNIGKQLLFLSVSSNKEGIFWNEVELADDEVDSEKEAVTYYVRSKARSFSSRYVEMIKENGKWKINNILDI
uniref:hypothetical protein n=1 Tax=Carnobacterium sp. TaxID=48221 RepID=UPI00344D6509